MTNSELTVATASGTVLGKTRGALLTWRGIPYAAAPVGELRFRAPRPVQPWNGIKEAFEFGPASSQLVSNPMIGVAKNSPQGEDCLTLNVTRKADGAKTPRPVMVWIHGGAYTLGASSSTMYGGTKFVENGDIIYVSINYRLGALGYTDFTRYSTPERPIESNLGLRDQVAALQWVRDNIAAFGGDPNNVTVFGESAGANAVTTLMCVPTARGLFARAISQSSAPSSVYSAARNAEWARMFVEILGGTDDNAVGLLTSSTPEELIAANEKLKKRLIEELPGTLTNGPVVDGDFLPVSPMDAFRNGLAAPIPLLIGSNDREGAFFQKIMKVLPTSGRLMDKMFSLTDPQAREDVLAAYPGYPRAHVATDVAGDITFWEPSIQVADSQSKVAPTWVYRYDFATPLLRLTGLNATHLTEVGPVFGEPTSGMSGITLILGGRSAAKRVSARLHSYWIEFATTGRVGDQWPQYDAASRRTLIVDVDDRVELDPRGDRRRAWAGFNTYH